MILPDINLLLYANVSSFKEHRAARRWWEETLNGKDDVGLSEGTVFGFIRIATNRRVFDPPMSVDAALQRVESWLARRRVRFLVPGPDHLKIAFALHRTLGVAGNLTSDVQLAALAIGFQAEIHSCDVDFGRIPQLRWRNPLS